MKWILVFISSESVELFALDHYGNVANVATIVDVAICMQPGHHPGEQGLIPPELESHPLKISLDQGKARVPRLTLKSRVGNYIGEYLLVFSADGMETCQLKFCFSTGRLCSLLNIQI